MINFCCITLHGRPRVDDKRRIFARASLHYFLFQEGIILWSTCETWNLRIIRRVHAHTGGFYAWNPQNMNVWSPTFVSVRFHPRPLFFMIFLQKQRSHTTVCNVVAVYLLACLVDESIRWKRMVDLFFVLRSWCCFSFEANRWRENDSKIFL